MLKEISLIKHNGDKIGFSALCKLDRISHNPSNNDDGGEGETVKEN